MNKPYFQSKKPKSVKQETYSTGLNCLKKVLNHSEKPIKVTIQFKKHAFGNKK